jgi:molybdenum cofactor cytidylyltransferase
MRAFAVIPAAGTSSRMGRPKLLLPLAGRPLVLHTLAAWQASRVERVVIVVRPDDEALAEVVCSAGAEVVLPPAAPPDMKASLGYGLAHIQQRFGPTAEDAWLVAPADMPGLSPSIIDALLAEFSSSPGRVIVPTLAGRRGHPVLLPWPLAAELAALPPAEGLRALVDRSGPSMLACDHLVAASAAAFADIDTPEDLRRLAGK